MPDEFGRMGLGYYVLLCRELDALDIRHHYPAASIQMVLCNLKRGPEGKILDVWDFMPGWKKKEAEAVHEATPDELSIFFGAIK